MRSEEGPSSVRAAAFFDVDGTLVQSTIVHYYMFFRKHAMTPMYRWLWMTAFLGKCLYFHVLDKISRSKLNIVFYRGYGGMCVEDVKGRAGECHLSIIEPKIFKEALPCIAEHRANGHVPVLVTGSIDFIVAPLAGRLGIVHVVAPSLVERNGQFTGELNGPPVGEAEKARRVRRFAVEHGIDLAGSHAYGDSIADLPMLESVGHPHAVNPDRALGSVAAQRGWPIHRWSVARRRKGEPT